MILRRKETIKGAQAGLGRDSKIMLDYRPVHLNTLSNEVQSVPPKARVY